MNNENIGKPCLNCNTTLLRNATHCHHCGQAIKDARMTVGALLSDFFSNLFNLDGKIWKTLRHMWKPAFLTKEFVSGRRKRYFNPARFFAINLILHFLMMTYSMSHSDLELDTMEMAEDITKSELVTQYDTIATTLIPVASALQLDTLKRALFGDAKHVDQDTLFSDISIFTNLGNYGILKKDAYSLSSEELYDKYKITGWWNKLFIRQTIRINQNRESTFTFIIGNLSWVVMLVLFFIAALMKLIYSRGSYYYIEHAILLMLLHAKVFLILNVVMLVTIFFADVAEDKIAAIVASIYGFTILYLFITMKIYYQQGWFKTLVKLIIIGFGYLIALIVFMVIVSAIGAALF